MDPNYYLGHLLLGSVHTCKKQFEEALTCYMKLIDLYGREPLILNHLARLYGIWGKRDEAKKLVAELQAMSSERHVPPAHFVWTSIALGDREEALANLERAFEERDPLLPFVFIWPWAQIDELKTDPRVQSIMQKMGLKS